jgi:hypothetical protein
MAENDSVIVGKDMLYGAAIVILACLLMVSIFTSGFGFVKPAVAQVNQTGAVEQKLPDAELKSKTESFINNAGLVPSGYSVKVSSLVPYDSHTALANISIMQGTQVVQSASAYISNDGSSIFLGTAFRMNQTPKAATGAQTDTGAATKVAKPKAEAFVMSFCPYGLQFLKAYVPVIELLGSKADIEVDFVSYSMHGKKELDGNNLIYCVQKEAKPKLANYLRCSVEAGDYPGCVAKSGINDTAINACVSQLDTQYNITSTYNNQASWGGNYPPYPVEAGLNDQYGVQGSPTFVLNGQQANVNRSPEAIKQAICATFEQAPAECNTTLSNSEEAPGVGAIGSGSASGSTASCG